MQGRTFAFLCAVALTLSGCGPTPGASKGDGRYTGIGLYAPGELWGQQVRENAPKDSRLARLDDDEQVIVIVDSQTGEVRQCGNLSGYCVAMQPWSGGVTKAPLTLVKHGTDIAAEATGRAKNAE